MDRRLLAPALLCIALPLFGQCPKENSSGPTVSVARTLEGRLVYHDSIRQWFELKLDPPQCGQDSFELVRTDGHWISLEVLRGCRVRSHGTADIPSTGYYSLPMYQDVDQIVPIGSCTRQQPFPDFSNAKPDKRVRAYRVEMHINYGPGDHPIIFRITEANKELRPWQAYASYMLTGGFVLYGHCAEGFVIDKVFGTPQAKPAHFEEPRSPDDMAIFDPESAALAGKKDLHLGYTCVRGR
jgi:hypothetical protein